MKNQNDLIISIVAVVLALIFGGVFMATARQPVKPGPPETVVVSDAKMPEGAVKFTDALPGASATGQNTAGGGGGGGGGKLGAGGGAGRMGGGGGGGGGGSNMSAL